jgi:hypothetical protein
MNWVASLPLWVLVLGAAVIVFFASMWIRHKKLKDYKPMITRILGDIRTLRDNPPSSGGGTK